MSDGQGSGIGKDYTLFTELAGKWLCGAWAKPFLTVKSWGCRTCMHKLFVRVPGDGWSDLRLCPAMI